MKVLVYIQAMTGGGAEKNAVAIANNLQKIGHDVQLVVKHKNVITYEPEVPVECFEMTKSNGFIPAVWNLVKATFKLRGIKRKFKYDVCISLLPVENLVNILSGNPKKAIVCIRAFYSKTMRNRFYQVVFAKMFSLARYVASQTEEMKLDLTKNGIPEKKIVVINNGFDVEEILKKRDNKINSLENEKELYGQRNLITIGRIVTQKRQNDFIKIIKELQNYGDYKGIIIGKGRGYEEVLHKSISELEMEEKVTIVDYCNNPFEYFRDNQLFTLLSDVEGFPNVLVEAMISGVPVLSTKCPSGPAEILMDDEYGKLIPCLDNKDLTSSKLYDEHKELAKKIHTLFESGELSDMKQKGITRGKNYSYESIIKEWDKVISKGV